MLTPEECEAIAALCEEHAARGEWPQVHQICEQQIYASEHVSDTERARWMWRWACWIFQESMQTGRDISPARALLHDAIPLAKTDDHLLGRILVAITGVRSGADVELAAKRVWVLMRRHSELEQFRGRVLYNLAYSHAKRFQLVKAARYYRQAASLLQGRHQGWAYHNLAEICIELGRYRAAQAAAGKATPLLSPEDRHMHAGVLAYLAVATGHVERALSLIQRALADHECPPLTRAYLWYYEALAYQQIKAYDQVCERLNRIWACATEVQYLRLCDRVARLQAEVNLRKGVS